MAENLHTPHNSSGAGFISKSAANPTRQPESQTQPHLSNPTPQSNPTRQSESQTNVPKHTHLPKPTRLHAPTGKVVIPVATMLLALCALFTLAPLLLALVNSFKTKAELYTDILALPTSWNFDNYRRSLEKMHYLRSFLNTIAVASIGLSGMVLASSLAGWSLCRTKTRLSTFIFSLFVFSMLVPFNAIMIPLYRLGSMLHLSNSIPGLGAIYIGLGAGMAVFMYHGFAKTIPIDLEDAACIDGCTRLQTFRLVVFPLLLPVTATIAIMNLLWMWNDFLLPLIMLRSQRQYTLLLSTNMLFGQYSSDWPAILGALILTVLPVLALYALLQKHILHGIAEGAIKG